MGMHDDQRESESPEFPTRPPSPSRETAEYTPVVWRRAGEGTYGNKYAGLPPVRELEPEEPKSDWRNESYAALQETRLEGRPYPSVYSQPASELQPQHQTHPRRVPNNSYRHEAEYSHSYAQDASTVSPASEPTRYQSTVPTYSPDTSSGPPQLPQHYQRPASPYEYPPSPPKTNNSHQDAHSHTVGRPEGQTVAEADCKICNNSKHALLEFKTQLERVQDMFGAFGPYQDIHLEYSARGALHGEMAGFNELHRLMELVKQAGNLAQFIYMSGPVLKEKVECERRPAGGGNEGRAKYLDGEYKSMKRKLDADFESSSTPYPCQTQFNGQYAAQPTPNPAQPQPYTYEAAKTTPVQYEEISAAPTNDRRATAYLEHKALIDHQADTAYIKRSSNMGGMPLSAQHQNVPTFKVADISTNNTMDNKLKKLKDRLEAEISEVDNLTEEKKRLEDRCKELEGMVEEERERRRNVQEMNMRERIQFLGVVEGVVQLGRRNGDEPSGSRRAVVKLEGAGDGDDRNDRNDRKGGDVGVVGGEAAFRREVERLRQRNRVCESALEHIQRESRHMEDTAGKLNESRRGIELVLGRVLAGGPSAAAGAVTNPEIGRASCRERVF